MYLVEEKEEGEQPSGQADRFAISSLLWLRVSVPRLPGCDTGTVLRDRRRGGAYEEQRGLEWSLASFSMWILYHP